MLLTSFSELVSYMAVKDHTIPNILAHIVLRTLSPLDATSAYLSHLKEDGILESVGAFGMGNISNPAYTKPISLKEKSCYFAIVVCLSACRKARSSALMESFFLKA